MSCRCGRPGARTGGQRAVGLDRPGARPLMARPRWLPVWRARRCPRRYGPLYSDRNGGLCARRGRCGRCSMDLWPPFPPLPYLPLFKMSSPAMSLRMIALLRIISSSATSSTVAPVSWTFSSYSWILCRRVGVSPWPLKAPPKCSTTLWATQLRSPFLNGARLAGSGSLTV